MSRRQTRGVTLCETDMGAILTRQRWTPCPAIAEQSKAVFERGGGVGNAYCLGEVGIPHPDLLGSPGRLCKIGLRPWNSREMVTEVWREVYP